MNQQTARESTFKSKLFASHFPLSIIFHHKTIYIQPCLIIMLCKYSSWNNLTCNQSSVDLSNVCMENYVNRHFNRGRMQSSTLHFTSCFFLKFSLPLPLILVNQSSINEEIFLSRLPSLTINLIIVWIAIDYTSHSWDCSRAIKKQFYHQSRIKVAMQCWRRFIILCSFAIDTEKKKRGRKSFSSFLIFVWCVGNEFKESFLRSVGFLWWAFKIEKKKFLRNVEVENVLETL